MIRNIMVLDVSLMTTCAGCAAAVSSALAAVLRRNLGHHRAGVALLGLDNHGVSFLHALALVGAVAVAALVRHGGIRESFVDGF